MESQPADRFVQARTEAANRAEATALLIRCGYRVYRPEADIEGEDLVVRPPPSERKFRGELRPVQLKARCLVDWKRYGDRGIWMLFPSASYNPSSRREWFLVEHDRLYGWVEGRHGQAPKWDRHWTYPKISKDLMVFLREWQLVPLGEGREDRFVDSESEGYSVIRDGVTIPLSELHKANES